LGVRRSAGQKERPRKLFSGFRGLLSVARFFLRARETLSIRNVGLAGTDMAHGHGDIRETARAKIFQRKGHERLLGSIRHTRMAAASNSVMTSVHEMGVKSKEMGIIRAHNAREVRKSPPIG
jgi:hypothetical protein